MKHFSDFKISLKHNCCMLHSMSFVMFFVVFYHRDICLDIGQSSNKEGLFLRCTHFLLDLCLLEMKWLFLFLWHVDYKGAKLGVWVVLPFAAQWMTSALIILDTYISILHHVYIPHLVIRGSYMIKWPSKMLQNC